MNIDESRIETEQFFVGTYNNNNSINNWIDNINWVDNINWIVNINWIDDYNYYVYNNIYNDSVNGSANHSAIDNNSCIHHIYIYINDDDDKETDNNDNYRSTNYYNPKASIDDKRATKHRN